MRLLQKILPVGIVCVFGGNAEVNGMQPPALPVAAPVSGVNILDFNTIATIATVGQPPVVATMIPSSLQPKIYEPAVYNAVGSNNLRYVYFSVISHDATPAAPFQHAIATQIANLADLNIFFPADGSQPTTADAVNYALANIDNKENSPITDWYMKMFGVIPFQNDGTSQDDYIKAGWKNTIKPICEPIMCFDDNTMIDIDIVTDPENKQQINKRRLFIKKFRKIASTSAGRMLLYRILIEIRRHNGEGHNIGIIESGIPPVSILDLKNHRNIARNIKICGGNGFYFGYSHNAKGGAYLRLSNFIPPLLLAVGGKKSSYYSIVRQEIPMDVAIFHEMNHWFHLLRHPNRYFQENNDKIAMFAKQTVSTAKNINFSDINSNNLKKDVLDSITDIKVHIVNAIIALSCIDAANYFPITKIDRALDYIVDDLIEKKTKCCKPNVRAILEVDNITRDMIDSSICSGKPSALHQSVIEQSYIALKKTNATENVTFKEACIIIISTIAAINAKLDINNYKFGKYYWDIQANDKKQEIDVSAQSWKLNKKIGNACDIDVVDFEEMRNILGGDRITASINGDDLSENLYRECVKIPPRFGYSGGTYYEDENVINKVITSSNVSSFAAGLVDYAYTNTSNKTGKKACRVFN